MKFGVFRKLAFLALTALALRLVPTNAAPRKTAVDVSSVVHGDAVLDHLARVIQWYRGVNNLVQSSSFEENVLLHDRTHQTALRALQLAFDFARAEAQLRATAAQQSNDGAGAAVMSESRNIEQASLRAAQRVKALQAQIEALESAIAKSPRKQLADLEGQKQALTAELNLAKEVQKTVQTMVAFSTDTGAGNSGAGLSGQINDLERTVPEVRRDAQVSPTSKPAVNQPRQEPDGLIGLVGLLFTLGQNRSDAKSIVQETAGLELNIGQLKEPLARDIRSAIARSDQIARSLSTEDIDQIAAAQREIVELTSRFKQLSTALVPLGEEQISVEATRGNIDEWNASISQRYRSAGRRLLIRAGGLAIMIFFIVAVSEVWRRAIFRYIRETRRRRQFLVLRRVIVTCAIAIIVILGFVTEFGSLATYAGFLTAGVALALQNVLLSVVAYFFLIGKYGIRVGDRVTISGVTGEVVDVGLVRMYLMELTGEGAFRHSTGRVVVYSNAILFQPSALFKQLPGIDYLWHGVTLTLTAESDFQAAEAKLTAAAKSVYNEYRRKIELQHEAFEKSVEMQVKNPEPQAQLRYSDAGLEFTVRYPVEANHAPETDAKMMKSLYDAISSDSNLAIAPQGSPRLEKTA